MKNYWVNLISAEGYENANVHYLPQKMVKVGMGVTNTSDLILKEIYGICETKNPTEEQVKWYKMTEREYYRRFDNLSGK